LHHERLRQRKRLEREGFLFTVWSGAVILSRLRKQREITRHYFPWLEPYICGPQTQLELQSNLQRATIHVLASQLGEAAEGDHTEIRKLWQDGHAAEALNRIRRLKSEPLSWGVLPSATRAKILRLEGRLLLTAGDISTAKGISAEADQLHPADNMRLVAMIAQAEGRLSDAIKVLDSETDPDSQALKAALQIQSGRPDRALEILAALPDHPDAYRLRAIIYFGRGEAEKAKAEAEKALALAPTWYWMRRTAAMMRYLVGVSPVALPKQIADWPEPINPSLVRQDDESLAARRAAAVEFEQLCDPKFEHSADELACIQAWHVACLADNPDCRAAAEQLARRILEANPSNYRVLTWVLGRDLDVNVEASVAALNSRLNEGSAAVEEIVSLIAANTKAGRFAEAQVVLDHTKEIFERDSAMRLWDLWQSQLGTIVAVTRAGSAGDREGRRKEILARLHNAEQGGDGAEKWHQYLLLAQLGCWEDIAPVARELVTALRTPDAVRMASYALYNTRDFTGCLGLLDSAPMYFPKRELPSDLRRLRVFAQRAVGAVSDAIRTARELFEEAPTREPFLELTRLCFLAGDFKSLALHARQHVNVADLTALDQLTLAFYLKAEDQPLALALWRRAIELGVDDDHVGMAFEIGNKLGVDVELKPLVHRLVALGREQKGGVQAVRLDELRDWAIQRRQHVEQIWQLLRQGQTPNHIALGVLGCELARAFHRVPATTSSRLDGVSAGPVCQRFGGRIGGMLPVNAEHRWRLNADITAILNAAHFGLLEQIEAHFAPIRLPQDTILALTAMREGLRPGQPRRIEAQRQVLNAVSAGRIGRIDLDAIPSRQESDGDVADDVLQLLREALARDALVLEFLPVRSVDPMRQCESLPVGFARLLRDAHSVVDALVACGALSRVEGEKAADALGQRDRVPTDDAIAPWKKLLCRGAVVELLALAGVLDQAAATFRLSIPADDLNQDRNESEFVASSEVDAEWVGHLIDHLREGLERRRYEPLPQMIGDRRPSPGGHVPSVDERVLLDLMQFPGDESDVIWSDDRWVTSHEQRDGIPVAGTVDLLTWLKDTGTLSTAELWHALSAMRAADVRYIAFDEDELLAALCEASIADGHLVETKPLRVVRQYYARCLLEGEMLRPPSGGEGTPNPATEWNFLLACGRAVATAMVMVWNARPAEDAAVRADWLLRNMYTEDRGIHGTQTPQTGADDAYRVSVSLVSVITASLRLDGPTEQQRQARRDYLTWLHNRVIRPRFDADRGIVLPVLEQLKGTIIKSIQEEDEPLHSVAMGLMQRLWSDLPKDLRELLSTDQEFLKTLGVAIRAIVEIGPLRLERQLLWDTLSQILKDGGRREIEGRDGHRVTIELATSRPIAFAVKCDALGFEAHVGGGEFGFLSESVAERQESATRLAHWFDTPKARREDTVARIVGGQDPGTRIELAIEARRSSGEHFYRRFADSIKEGEQFHIADAIPADPKMLLDHLRLSETVGLSLDWRQAAQDLIEEVGVVGALERLGGLPIVLPNCVVTALAELPGKDRRRALVTVRRTLLASPVGVVQLADVWSRLPHARRHATAVLSCFAGLLADETRRPVFAAWLAVLQRVDEEFGFSESIRVMAANTRLALVWTHADRVFRILLSRGLPPEWIEQAFRGSVHALAPEIVFPDASYTDDVAAPRHVRAEDLVLAGLARIGTQPELATTLQAAFAQALHGKDARAVAKIVAAMINDRSDAGNALESWLATGRTWLSFLPEELRDDFSLEAIRSSVDNACTGIVNKSDERGGWFSLGAVLGHMPPADYARSALERVVSSVDLIDYLTRDPVLAIAAVNVIGSQAHHLSGETRRGAEEQLLRLAGALHDGRVDQETENELGDSIVATLIGCTWWQPDGDARAVALARLLERLAGIGSSDVFARGGRFLIRLCDALPVSEARHLWRVRDLLRLKTQL
jgi:tetratricopeptide (TPR) repeat protein